MAKVHRSGSRGYSSSRSAARTSSSTGKVSGSKSSSSKKASSSKSSSSNKTSNSKSSSSKKVSNSRGGSSAVSSSKKTDGKTVYTVVGSKSSGKSGHISKSGAVNTDKVTISDKGRNTISGHNNVTSKSESVKMDVTKRNSKDLNRFEKSKVSDAYQEYFDNLKDLVKSKMKKDTASGNSKSSYNPPKNSTYSERLNEYNKKLKSYFLQQYELDRIKKNNDKAY